MTEALAILGIGTYLPDSVSVNYAVAQGHCRQEDVRRTGIESVCVAPADLDGPEMAVRAARRAMDDAQITPADIDAVLYVRNHDEGHVLWPVASYLQHQLGAGRSYPLEIRQMSNGGLTALEVASFLAGSYRTVLVVTSDTFQPPVFNRYSSDPGTIYGDGATAVVVQAGSASTPARGRILAQARSGAAVLEALSRPIRRGHADEQPVNLQARRELGIESVGLGTTVDVLEERQAGVLDDVVKRAGLTTADIALFVLPNLGRARLAAQVIVPLGIEWDNTLWEWGRTVGHLGAGDQIAGLQQAIDSRALAAGQFVCLLGIGGGFTWSAAIVQIA